MAKFTQEEIKAILTDPHFGWLPKNPLDVVEAVVRQRLVFNDPLLGKYERLWIDRRVPCVFVPDPTKFIGADNNRCPHNAICVLRDGDDFTTVCADHSGQGNALMKALIQRGDSYAWMLRYGEPECA